MNLFELNVHLDKTNYNSAFVRLYLNLFCACLNKIHPWKKLPAQVKYLIQFFCFNIQYDEKDVVYYKEGADPSTFPSRVSTVSWNMYSHLTNITGTINISWFPNYTHRSTCRTNALVVKVLLKNISIRKNQ